MLCNHDSKVENACKLFIITSNLKNNLSWKKTYLGSIFIELKDRCFVPNFAEAKFKLDLGQFLGKKIDCQRLLLCKHLVTYEFHSVQNK